MHIDLDSDDVPSTIGDEICVIGAGAAGITTARRLLELGHSVLLLESGGLDYEPRTAALNAGENIGEPYYDLEESRLRFFGGTTAIWGGRLAELDPIDLQHRPWVPHSGWPISWSDLHPYYAPARQVFGDDPPYPEPSDLARIGAAPPAFDPAKLEVGLWTFDQKFNRFVFDTCRDLVSHPRCRILTHATVTELQMDEAGRHVVSAAVRGLGGKAVSVSAQAFVLAAGGLENPRLLLASRSVLPAGVGNRHDQVGRYFMEHPHARGGRLVGARAWAVLRTFARKHRIHGKEVSALIKPSPALQAETGILNTALTIVARKPADASQAWAMRTYTRIKHTVAPTRQGRAIWMLTKRLAKGVQRGADPLRPWLLHRLGLRELALSIRAEQAPNPASRVVLTDERDALDMPRIALDWRMSEIDTRSVAVLARTLDEEMRRTRAGGVEVADWLSTPDAGWRTDPLIGAHPIGGYHHMGTTRMSETAATGVTDRDGRVHETENLYVVGSSVFATSGWANPTLTIVALALRTSERLSLCLGALKAAS